MSSDENGQPKHSWRVLILPFLEQSRIYEQYKFDEPWNSPNNMAVTSQAVPVYCCPSSPAGSTSLLAEIPCHEDDELWRADDGTVIDAVRGEVVACVDGNGREVARGLVNYSADETRRIMGSPSQAIEAILGYQVDEELIHRDNLVLV